MWYGPPPSWTPTRAKGVALFLTTVNVGTPKFSDKTGAHFRLNPNGTQAIVEFWGTPDDYAEAKNDPDTEELTRRRARALSHQWDLETQTP